MFTGIVEGVGKVRQIRHSGRLLRLKIQAPFSLRSLKKGDSIAVNGCCLTITQKRPKAFWTDLSEETLSCTNLGKVKEGAQVNLERAARMTDFIGGHLVSGHVDSVGKVIGRSDNGHGTEIEIRFPKNLRPYLIPKGSVAVDGVSMTVNRLRKDRFTLAVIPHTLKGTNLEGRKAGDTVNLEVDMMGKYIVNYLASRRSRR